VKDAGPAPAETVAEIARDLGVHEVVAHLLWGRGYTDTEKARAFVHMETEMLCDPFSLRDMDRAVARLREALERGEQVTIYGDYDVDGVTAVCLLYLYLQEKGGRVGYYIPNRLEEGHGVSCSAIDELAAAGVSLIVTVDCGITAHGEIAYARERGVDFIVTDHHECCGDVPPAVATVNPHRADCDYPFKQLAGVGVVFKLLCALEATLSGEALRHCVKRMSDTYADLVAIGTIADVMPIQGENKLLVAKGLQMLANTKRAGLAALMDASSYRTDKTQKGAATQRKKVKVTSGYIGYTLAPRINAVGRLKSASLAVELFLADDPQQAAHLAEILCDANRERQAEENRIVEQAYEIIESTHDFEHDPVIILESDSWHHGVIGIVASRITEKYGMPSLLVSFVGNDPDHPLPTDRGKGSGRSVKGMNLVEALWRCEEFLPKFGGHELAAGLSICRADMPRLREAVNRYAREALAGAEAQNQLEADLELPFEVICMELARDLQVLEPYGIGNPVPVFVARSLQLKEITPISGGKHTRLIVGDDTSSVSAMCFSCPTSRLDLYAGDRVDLLFTIDINEWDGRKTVQLIVKDVKLAERQLDQSEQDRRRFEEIWAGSPFSREEDVLPSRADFAAVYTFVRQCVRYGCDCMTHRAMLAKLSASAGGSMSYVKLKYVIRVLQEMNLMGIDEISDEMYRFKLNFSDTKVDLDKSNILKKLRSQQAQSG